MKRFVAILCLAVLSISLISPLTQNVSANAIGFNAGRIMDDNVFTNKNSMSVAQIQAFLNSKVPNCDTYGTKPSEYGGGTRAQWGQAKYGQSTFPCLKDYVENGNSAAQMIYNVSQEFSINPQVFIVLLQKEQGLVTDEWPLSIQYRSATGYGCPDTAPCSSLYYGLGNQLTWSGKMFRAILNASPSWYTPYVLGSNFIRYSPDASCGGSQVTIENRSTQALYNYTPYQPNAGAINAGYGQAPCGAYGNRNFFLYFRDWFGPTTGSGYEWALNSYGVYSEPELINKVNADQIINMSPGEVVHARIWARNSGVVPWRSSDLLLGTSNVNSAFRDESWISRDRPARLAQSQVNYGGLGSFDFKIKAPQTAGVYSEKFNIVIDGLTWFNNAGPTIYINVVNPLAAQTYSNENRLAPGAVLTQNQAIYSPERYSILKLENGKLNLYVNYQKLWTASTTGYGEKLVNQTDGNLVLLDKTDMPIWSSGTAGQGASTLTLKTEGNLSLTNAASAVTWSTSTAQLRQLQRPNEMLDIERIIFAGQYLDSIDRRYRLSIQQDGNIVLYSAYRAIWSSGTVGSGGKKLVQQADGNLVLYTDTDKPVWATGTSGNGRSSLMVQQDGNIVLYNTSGPTWSTRTSGVQ